MILSLFLKKIKKNYQILIPELPGHNNIEFNKISIEKFTQTIALFIKKKTFKFNIFYSFCRRYNSNFII